MPPTGSRGTKASSTQTITPSSAQDREIVAQDGNHPHQNRYVANPEGAMTVAGCNAQQPSPYPPPPPP